MTDDIGYTAKIKVYPDGSTAITAADRPIFRPAGWEERSPKAKREFQTLPEPEQSNEWGEIILGPTRADYEAGVMRQAANLDRSRRRALAKLRDYCLSNSFRWFVTLTLDAQRIDRYDMDAITRRLSRWCDNRVRRDGLAYILVPERHQDGAVHFHGFFNDAVEAVDSGTLTKSGWKKPRRPRSEKQRALWLSQGAQIVYNLPEWDLGYTTAIGLYGSYHAAVAYVCKYISKAREKVGGRWYYSGGKLQLPDVQYSEQTLEDVLRSDTAREYVISSAGVRLAYDFTSMEGWNADHREGLGRDRGQVNRHGKGRG